MNGKIVIPIVIGIIISIIGIATITNQESDTIEVEDSLNRDLQPIDETDTEILKKLEEIKKNAENFKNLETDYDPTREREWITSGPFQIDRSEYALGENIFLKIGELETTEKGQVVFLRPSNSTHYSVFLTIPFDGTTQPFGQYFTPKLSKVNGICSIDDIVGEWRVVFRGTEYDTIEFTVTDKIVVPGEELKYERVC